MTPLKNKLFKKVLVPILYGCKQTSAINAARAIAGENDVTFVGIIYVPEGESLSIAAARAREVRQTLKGLSHVKQIHRRTEVYVTHRPWDEMAKVIEKEKPDLLVLEYPCQFENLKTTPEEVLAHPPCDIAIVNPHIPDKFNDILIPIRGGPYAELALRTALRHRLDPAALGRDLPAEVCSRDPRLRAGVAAIRVHDLFLAVKQLLDLFDIRFVRGGCRHGVHEPRVHIRTDMRLHPEVPLVAFFRLVHLRIALARCVLRRARRRDDRRVHDAAALQHQSLAGEVGVDAAKDLRGDVVFFQQVPEVQDRRLIGRGLRHRQARKPAHGHVFDQRLFHRRIAQREPVLHQVHPQHLLQRVRVPAVARDRVEGFDQIQQRLPGNDPFHLGEEHLPAGLFLLARVFRVPETHLVHRSPRLVLALH